MSAATTVPCRVCGGAALTPWVRGRDRLTTWAAVYPDEYYGGVLFVGAPADKSGQRGATERAGVALAGTRVLEIGCSQGDLLCLLRDGGARPAGVEPSRMAREAAQERGLAVVETIGEELPRHLTHFSPHALERLAQRAGLSCRRVEYSATSFLGKSFIDSCLADGCLKDGPRPIRGVANRIFRWMEAGLRVAGNRPHVTMLLERRG